MKAGLRDRYGLSDVIEIRETEKPVPADDEVLVRVRASSVNPLDWHTLTGVPYMVHLVAGLRKPKQRALGVDFAGTVEAVGRDVTQFRPGDEVFGARDGSFAEYVCIRQERAIVPKPRNLTFEEAAAVPVAGVTALQGLRDKAHLQAGQKVLVNGGSGGVGTFTVQIAKAFGAEVNAVCSTHNVETARSIGADRVIDYTKEDFTRTNDRYDVMADIAGNRSWSERKRVLADKAVVVGVGGPKTNRWIGPLGHDAAMALATRRSDRRFVFFLAKIDKASLKTLSELLETGKVSPVIDRRYAFGELAQALSYLGEGHARGKVVITM
jgi:NADPH:quinone reductase-like Zn-dependent oxidoreductase